MEPRRNASLCCGVGLAALTCALSPLTATAAPTPEQKCQAAKIKVAGQYYACRTKAEAKAVASGLPADVSKCIATLEKKIQKIEAKYDDSFPCGYDGGSLNGIRRELGLESEDIACELSGGGRAWRDDYTGSIAFVDFSSSLPTEDSSLEVRNHSNLEAKARCFFATEAPCAVGAEFAVTISAQSLVRWTAGTGDAAASIPPVPTQPFYGTLVCVQVDASNAPLGMNSLMVSQRHSSSLGKACARDGTGISATELLDPDSTLCLGCSGNPSTDEYEACPHYRVSAIENCWSLSSSFNFSCQ